MSAVHYDSYTEARAHLKDLLDAAGQGRVATARRDAEYAAVVDAERLRYALAMLCPSTAEAVAENDGWSVFLPGLPIAADGASFDEAVAKHSSPCASTPTIGRTGYEMRPTTARTGAWSS
ncbi:hypothetical protein [Nocardia sp. NPDC004604]|uniref:hypothetical protein n=1 Tax=Nocardia sp. NPDC004604 TaxID=3157013 RepID=UPI0033A9E607